MDLATRTVAIVGAGAAGAATATELRSLAYQGDIVLVGAEEHLPYDRPPLSKGLLTGLTTVDRLWLHSASDYADLDVDLRLGHEVEFADQEAKTLHLASGEEIAFDTLVAATGVSARPLGIATGICGVHYLRSIADANALRSELGPGRRIGILGAGFIGLEVAASASKLGCSVEVVEATNVPLEAKVGREVGERLRVLHESHGVRFHMGVTVVEFTTSVGRLAGVRLDNGAYLELDAMLIGIGTRANTAWLRSWVDAAGAPVADDSGIRCDPLGRACEGLYAAGDIAAYFDVRASSHTRHEHRMNAGEQGRFVARSILGANEAFAAVPFFWSDQYDVKIQVIGTPGADAAFTIEETFDDSRRFVGAFRQGGELVAAAGWNAAKHLQPYRRELQSQLLAGRANATPERIPH